MFGRLRLRARRRWFYFAGGAIVGIIGYLLIPLGRGGPVLELVVAAPDGGFAGEIEVPQAWADTTGLVGGAVVRVPLVLAVANTGGKAAVPERLELSVPSRFRLVRSNGNPLLGHLTAGSPLVRYEVPSALPEAQPGGPPLLLPSLDTLWLEPVLLSYYCIAFSDSVPDFVPAPPAPVEAISRVQIFYSFEGGTLEERQTGLLTVQLDPELLRRKAPEPAPTFTATYSEPKTPMPAFEALVYRGSRRAFCGEAEYPLELLSTLWETPGGGRFFVLDHGGAPRKYLFDLDRDSIIELEIWDPDGDGDFEARREARLPIPAFLMPPPGPPEPDLAVLDSIPEEVLAFYDRYRGDLAKPYIPRSKPPDTTTRTGRFRPLALDGTRKDEDRRERTAGRTLRPGAPSSAPDFFGGRTGRPDRTTPAPPSGHIPAPPARRDPQRPLPGTPAPGRPQMTEPGRQAPDPARTEPTTDPAPRRPERPEPKLLGRPVDSIPPPPRPDTTGAR
jgi:hypothetical protein